MLHIFNSKMEVLSRSSAQPTQQAMDTRSVCRGHNQTEFDHLRGVRGCRNALGALWWRGQTKLSINKSFLGVSRPRTSALSFFHPPPFNHRLSVTAAHRGICSWRDGWTPVVPVRQIGSFRESRNFLCRGNLFILSKTFFFEKPQLLLPA